MLRLKLGKLTRALNKQGPVCSLNIAVNKKRLQKIMSIKNYDHRISILLVTSAQAQKSSGENSRSFCCDVNFSVPVRRMRSSFGDGVCMVSKYMYVKETYSALSWLLSFIVLLRGYASLHRGSEIRIPPFCGGKYTFCPKSLVL